MKFKHKILRPSDKIVSLIRQDNLIILIKTNTIQIYEDCAQNDTFKFLNSFTFEYNIDTAIKFEDKIVISRFKNFSFYEIIFCKINESCINELKSFSFKSKFIKISEFNKMIAVLSNSKFTILDEDKNEFNLKSVVDICFVSDNIYTLEENNGSLGIRKYKFHFSHLEFIWEIYKISKNDFVKIESSGENIFIIQKETIMLIINVRIADIIKINVTCSDGLIIKANNETFMIQVQNEKIELTKLMIKPDYQFVKFVDDLIITFGNEIRIYRPDYEEYFILQNICKISSAKIKNRDQIEALDWEGKFAKLSFVTYSKLIDSDYEKNISEIFLSFKIISNHKIQLFYKNKLISLIFSTDLIKTAELISDVLYVLNYDKIKLYKINTKKDVKFLRSEIMMDPKIISGIIYSNNDSYILYYDRILPINRIGEMKFCLDTKVLTILNEGYESKFKIYPDGYYKIEHDDETFNYSDNEFLNENPTSDDLISVMYEGVIYTKKIIFPVNFIVQHNNFVFVVSNDLILIYKTGIKFLILKNRVVLTSKITFIQPYEKFIYIGTKNHSLFKFDVIEYKVVTSDLINRNIRHIKVAENVVVITDSDGNIAVLDEEDNIFITILEINVGNVMDVYSDHRGILYITSDGMIGELCKLRE